MSTFNEWAEAFLIFSRYSERDEEAQIAVEHDVIYAGPENNDGISAEDFARLAELGWYYDSDYDCFMKNV